MLDHSVAHVGTVSLTGSMPGKNELIVVDNMADDPQLRDLTVEEQRQGCRVHIWIKTKEKSSPLIMQHLEAPPCIGI